MENDDKPFQDLGNDAPVDANGNEITAPVYVDLDSDDPELLKLRREAGDPTAPAEVTS